MFSTLTYLFSFSNRNLNQALLLLFPRKVFLTGERECLLETAKRRKAKAERERDLILFKCCFAMLESNWLVHIFITFFFMFGVFISHTFTSTH